jgi:hypothetical protein
MNIDIPRFLGALMAVLIVPVILRIAFKWGETFRRPELTDGIPAVVGVALTFFAATYSTSVVELILTVAIVLALFVLLYLLGVKKRAKAAPTKATPQQ